MNKVICSLVLFLASLHYIECTKCDIMNDDEFKEHFRQIGDWGKGKCEAAIKAGIKELSQAQLDAAKACYETHAKPLMTSKNAVTITNFMTASIFLDRTRQVCSDDKVKDEIMEKAKKDVGMRCGYAMKKEIDANCDPWKECFSKMNPCLMEIE